MSPSHSHDASGRPTLVPFDPDEAAVIRAALRDGALTPSCPRCGRPLASSLPVAGGGSMAMVWELQCNACRCSMFVQDPG
ncbi:MAG: hypothetical protein PVF27_02695 [Gemmatimonadales bacterium]|jgi:hypothetical protein